MTENEYTERIALRGAIQQLKAENTRLRAALEAAPKPVFIRSMKYEKWYKTHLAEALKGESHE